MLFIVVRIGAAMLLLLFWYLFEGWVIRPRWPLSFQPDVLGFYRWIKMEQQLECPICYINMNPLQPFYQLDLLTCGHIYHRTCLSYLASTGNFDSKCLRCCGNAGTNNRYDWNVMRVIYSTTIERAQAQGLIR